MEFSPQWSNWQYFNIGPGNGSMINRRMKQCSPNSLPPYVNTRLQKSSSQQRKLQNCVSPTFYVARLLHTNGHIYKIKQCDHFMPICQRVSSLEVNTTLYIYIYIFVCMCLYMCMYFVKISQNISAFNISKRLHKSHIVWIVDGILWDIVNDTYDLPCVIYPIDF